MIWLDPSSPAVRSAVVSGGWGRAPHSTHANLAPVDPDEIDTISTSLADASTWLANLTGMMVHPAGTAVEDYRATPNVHRLSPRFRPVLQVEAIHWLGPDCMPEVSTEPWCQHGNSVYFDSTGWLLAGQYLMFDQGLFAYYCGTRRGLDVLRVEYRFGSTVTASARRVVIALAHQLWLSTSRCAECEECQLPDRTTSVTREGLTYSLYDPGMLQSNMTGIPAVDQWVQATNPRHATRVAGVHTTDSPPPVVRALRGEFPTYVPSSPRGFASGMAHWVGVAVGVTP